MTEQELLKQLRQMVLIRGVEEAIVAQYREQDEIIGRKQEPEHAIRCPTHLSIGQEAPAVGVCSALEPTDVIYSTHRCHAHYLAKGGSLPRMVAELFGKSTGCAKGKGGSMHLVDTSVGMLGSSAIVGGSIPLAVGSALAAQMRGESKVAVCFFGDGAVEEGIFHESLHFAALRKLPVLFACENNVYATLSHIEARQRTPIHERAACYGAIGESIDGNDVEAVTQASRRAVLRARAGDGPTLFEFKTYRWLGHVGPLADTGSARRSQPELEFWKARCPIERLKVKLPADQVEAIELEVGQEIAAAFSQAKSDPLPALEELFVDV
ncbi:MAG: thiamine pyrophosphate-dependent dehydrogenase E1 component subunit alpha [Vulcanimicrobiota bacterium]